MASYINITLDTLAPGSLSLSINNGASVTTSTSVTLTIGCTGADVAQMKIWGIEGVANEAAASWEAYSTSKTVSLPTSDGSKTVYIKVRDDVYNESSSVSSSITLLASLPTVSISGPDVSKISKIASKNVSAFTFSCNQNIKAWKVMVVQSSSASHDTATNVQIGADGGSTNMTGSTVTNANTAISCSVYGSDLETASAGDGLKIVKVFVQNEADVWSAA